MPDFPPVERGQFLEALAAELAAHPEAVGVGRVHRVARELQRRFMCGHEVARGPAARAAEREERRCLICACVRCSPLSARSSTASRASGGVDLCREQVEATDRKIKFRKLRNFI
jgi:hypothetical protein